MKIKVTYFIALFMLMCSSISYSDDILTGEKKLACEATMCLMANGSKPHECRESLKKYASIKIKKHGKLNLRKTLKARKNFLKLCPTGEAEQEKDKALEALVSSNSSDIQPPPPDDCGINEFKRSGLINCR